MILPAPRRTAWDLKFSLLGVPVRVNPLFWLVTLLFAYHPQIPFGHVPVRMAALFLAILVHEFGHALCGRYYGDRQNYVVLYWLGGLTFGSREPGGHWPRIWLSLWGPLAGFMLAGVAYGGMLLMPERPDAKLAYLLVALDSLVWVGIFWGAVNLLPVFPLDGGNIMREVVLWKARRRGDSFVLMVSVVVGVAAAAGFLVLRYYGWCDLFPTVLFLCLAYSCWDLRRQIGAHGSLGGDEEEPRQPWEQDADWWKK